jgi:hypothetical protein
VSAKQTLKIISFFRLLDIVLCLYSVTHLVKHDNVPFGVVFDLVPVVIEEYFVSFLVVLLESVSF